MYVSKCSSHNELCITVWNAVFCNVTGCYLCRGLGAGTSCPKLVMGRQNERVVLQESPDILRFADKNIRNEEDRLYPDDPELQKLVQSWGMWVNAICNYLAYLLVESSDSSVAFLFFHLSFHYVDSSSYIMCHSTQ